LSQIDLNEFANNARFRVSIVSNAEENMQGAQIRRFKDVVLFVTTILFLVAAFSFCGYLLIGRQFSIDDKKWAMTIATSIITGFVGYITGKKSA
jgi:hypothetical protein